MKETHYFVQLAGKNKYRIKQPLSFVHNCALLGRHNEFRDCCRFENPFGNITFLHMRVKLNPGEWCRPPGPLVNVIV